MLAELEFKEPNNTEDSLSFLLPHRLSAGITVKKGSMKLTAGPRSFLLDESDGVWLCPESDLIRTELYGEGAAEFSVLILSHAFYRGAGEGSAEPKLWRLISGRDFGITAFRNLPDEIVDFSAVFSSYGKSDACSWLRIESGLHRRLFMLLSDAGRNAPVRGNNRLHKKDLEAVRSVRQRIEENPGEMITVSKLAAGSGINVDKLKKGFKLEYGRTVHSYRKECRIIRAAELLSGPGLSVTEIAFRCGYSSHAAFSSAFKEYYGASPSVYRKNTK